MISLQVAHCNAKFATLTDVMRALRTVTLQAKASGEKASIEITDNHN